MMFRSSRVCRRRSLRRLEGGYILRDPIGECAQSASRTQLWDNQLRYDGTGEVMVNEDDRVVISAKEI
jgi:hypothetical protein